MEPKVPRQVLHCNWDPIKKKWWTKKAFNLIVEPQQEFTQVEIEQWMKSHPDVRIVLRHR